LKYVYFFSGVQGIKLFIILLLIIIVKLVKVKLSLQLIHFSPYHEDFWGSGHIVPTFLTSTLDGGEWSASRPGLFTPGENTPVSIG
jgi:hypothetical protein